MACVKSGRAPFSCSTAVPLLPQLMSVVVENERDWYAYMLNIQNQLCMLTIGQHSKLKLTTKDEINKYIYICVCAFEMWKANIVPYTFGIESREWIH